MAYELTEVEENKLDDYWKFIDVFNRPLNNKDNMFSVTKYR